MYFMSSSHGGVSAVTVLSNLASRIRQRRGKILRPDTVTPSRPWSSRSWAQPRSGSPLAQRESLAQDARPPDDLIRRLVGVLVIAIGATLPAALG